MGSATGNLRETGIRHRRAGDRHPGHGDAMRYSPSPVKERNLIRLAGDEEGFTFRGKGQDRKPGWIGGV